MKRRMLAAAGLLAPLAGGVWAQSQSGGQRAGGKTYPYSGGGIRGVSAEAPDGWLVSPSEAIDFGGEAGFNEVPALRPRSVVPLIDILKPEPLPDTKLKSPFPLSVQFRWQGDAPVDPSTFRVLYGAEKVDITPRLARAGTLTREGFTIEAARFPRGRHRLILQIQDNRQRIAERELRLDVE